MCKELIVWIGEGVYGYNRCTCVVLWTGDDLD